jgi:pilus assembly protein Flp/PilA
MSNLYLRIRSWMTREEGQDLAEYALLIGLIALVVVVAVTILGSGLTTVFNTIAATVAGWF